jgi:hypothetical protein
VPIPPSLSLPAHRLPLAARVATELKRGIEEGQWRGWMPGVGTRISRRKRRLKYDPKVSPRLYSPNPGKFLGPPRNGLRAWECRA